MDSVEGENKVQIRDSYLKVLKKYLNLLLNFSECY